MKEVSKDEPRVEDDPTIESDMRWHQLTQRHFEPETGEELTTAVVYAIAEAIDTDPVELKSPSLYDIVDVASIENAFFVDDAPDNLRDGTGTVEFHYGDQLVTIRSDGWIQVFGKNELDLA